MQKCVEENAQTAIDQADYQRRHGALLDRYEEAKKKLARITDQKQERAAKRENIALFLKKLEQSDTLLRV